MKDDKKEAAKVAAKDGGQKNPKVPCQLVGHEGVVNGVIINANQSHILVNLGPKILQVHGAYQIKFLVPGVDAFIDAESVVVKTRDEWQGSHKNPQPGIHIAELIFKNLSAEQRMTMAYLASLFTVRVPTVKS